MSWQFHFVMAGLVPAIPIIDHCAIPIEIAGTSPAMTRRVLPLLLLNLLISIVIGQKIFLLGLGTFLRVASIILS